MNCRQVEKRLPLYVSGDIGGRRGRRIGLHLEACPRCRAAFDTYAGERCRLREVRDLDRSQELTGFYDELAARLGPVRRAQAVRVSSRRTTLRRVGVSLAASVAICAALVWMLDGRSAADEVAIDRHPDHAPRAMVMAEPGELDDVLPFRSVATQSNAPARPRVIPATYEMMIMAGPRAAIPIVAPARPADSLIPRVRPYACPSSLTGRPDRSVY